MFERKQILCSGLMNEIKHDGKVNIFAVLLCIRLYQGFWIYFRIRHSFAHLRAVILSVDWSISRLQSSTCSSLPTVAKLVKLTQSIVIEIQRQSADLYKVQLCNRQFFVVSIAINMVNVYECHPLDCTVAFQLCQALAQLEVHVLI